MASPIFDQTNYINLIDLADSTRSNWNVSDVDTEKKKRYILRDKLEGIL